MLHANIARHAAEWMDECSHLPPTHLDPVTLSAKMHGSGWCPFLFGLQSIFQLGWLFAIRRPDGATTSLAHGEQTLNPKP